MICMTCGTQSPEDARVCLQCGEQISTPVDIANPGKNRKRARKGVIAFTILGAFACVLAAFAVLPEILKDGSQTQGPTTVTGGPALYSAPLSTPTPTPMPSPVLKTETYEIDTKAIGIQPDQMWWHPLLVKNDWRNARLVGKFIAQGGEKNDIEAIVTNEKGLINWRKNYLHRPEVWYKSGRVTEDTFNVPLPTGQSYFVFNNRFSVSANKTVRFNLRIEYERLAQP
jgi:predicted nucleic acid-binding Zn ribbon protein